MTPRGWLVAHLVKSTLLPHAKTCSEAPASYLQGRDILQVIKQSGGVYLSLPSLSPSYLNFSFVLSNVIKVGKGKKKKRKNNP